MKVIQPEKKIDVERLSMSLSRMWITRKDSRVLPMTAEQAVDFLTTFYRMEVESNWCVFRQTESGMRCIRTMSSFLTGSGHKRGLLICGSVGNGKTTMLKCVSKLYEYLVTEGYIAGSSSGFEYVSAKDLAFAVIEDKVRYDRLKSSKMLIVDDLGEEPTEVPLYGINHTPVKDVLMHRYEHRLLTLVSSNLNAKMIKEKYHDERLSDRMREMYEVVAIEDKSFRV